MPRICLRRRHKRIVRERRSGAFASIADLAHRVPELRRKELVLLASIGALNLQRALRSQASLRIRDGCARMEQRFSAAIGGVAHTPGLSRRNREPFDLAHSANS